MIKSIIFSIMSVCLMLSTQTFAGEVAVCKQYISKKQHRCIIKQLEDDVVKVGSQVVLYSPDYHWVATGEVVIKKGSHSIAIFKNAGPHIRRGLTAVFEGTYQKNTLNYDLAFDKPDY